MLWVKTVTSAIVIRVTLVHTVEVQHAPEAALDTDHATVPQTSVCATVAGWDLIVLSMPALVLSLLVYAVETDTVKTAETASVLRGGRALLVTCKRVQSPAATTAPALPTSSVCAILATWVWLVSRRLAPMTATTGETALKRSMETSDVNAALASLAQTALLRTAPTTATTMGSV